MESILFGLVPLVVAVALLLAAFRAHERYWALGFLGWQKVYVGLILYLFSGILTAIGQWSASSGPEAAGRLVLWQIASSLAAAAGIGLVLAGAIERLRELSEERGRLEDIRAGFDLFDSLRDIVAQPYAFLEILDFSLKEMVRAAGVECGGLWLYNPGKSEWVLTGWASMSEKLRQQTESVKGSGTGFDRLAVTHKARLFHTTDEIRVFFPEWEPEGFQSILGLPLATGTVGTPNRQILGVIVLADRSASHFDDDRARRLYAASDYIAAVIAEARITRQLEASRQQLDSVETERERDQLDFQHQLEARERQTEDLKAAWEDEKRMLEQKHAGHMSELQARAAEELDRTRAEWEQDRRGFERERESYESRIHDMMAAWEEERQSLEANMSSQVSELRSQAKEETDRMRIDFETRAAAAGAAEQERTSQLQQRWEEARRDHESALGRFENERAEWGRRLDQLNQDHQTERELARRREEQLTASHQEALAGLQRRIDELQSQLAAEQQHVASEREALHAAGQTLAELESTLAAERHARENAVTELTAQLENERQSAAQERQAIQQELQAARQLLEEREKQMSAHLVAARQAASEAEAHYQETLQVQKETSARAVADLQTQLQHAQEERQSIEDEAQSIRLMLDEREKLFAERIEAERCAIRELEAGHREALADERGRAEQTLQDLENRLQAERGRSETFEERFRMLMGEKAAFEERARQDLVEQHLNSRRQINAIKTRRAHLTDRLQRVLALGERRERLAALFQAAADDLPSPVELYLWRRDSERGSLLLAWMDGDRITQPIAPLPPWSFEVETIPAEGVTRIGDPERWDEIERTHDELHRAQWDHHWGSERKPRWVACWPWRISLGDPSADDSRVTGWLTAFGFGPHTIDDDQIASGGQWAGFLAATAIALSDGTPEGVDPSADIAVAPQAEPISRGEESPEELNSVILDWAAGQTEDALRLDLSARSRVAVTRLWLRDVLDRGRRSCRGTESHGSEFSVSTEKRNGHTILRLIRSSALNQGTTAEVMSVDDSNLTSMQVNDPARSAHDGTPPGTSNDSVSARWLIYNGDRLGLELQFDSRDDAAEPAVSSPDVAIAPHTRAIAIVNFQGAMSELIEGMLQSLGYSVRAFDFDHARESFGALKIDAAIISAASDEAGWEFARWAKGTVPALPVIVVIDDSASAAASADACDRMLQIPFQIQELGEAITKLTAVAAAQIPG